MKKIAVILLLFSILISTGGYHFLYMAYQIELKQDMKTYLRENDASQIGTHFCFTTQSGQISDSAFLWEDENEEFRYKNELYDVVSIKKLSGKMLVCCLKDNNENDFEKLWNEVHHSKRDASSLLLFSFLKIYSPIPQCSSFSLLSLPETSPAYAIRCIAEIKNAKSEVQTPPPQKSLFSLI